MQLTFDNFKIVNGLEALSSDGLLSCLLQHDDTLTFGFLTLSVHFGLNESIPVTVKGTGNVFNNEFEIELIVKAVNVKEDGVIATYSVRNNDNATIKIGRAMENIDCPEDLYEEILRTSKYLYFKDNQLSRVEVSPTTYITKRAADVELQTVETYSVKVFDQIIKLKACLNSAHKTENGYQLVFNIIPDIWS